MEKMIKNVFYVAMAFALNYIFVPSLFLHYSKFPVSISSGVALWVKKVKTTQTDREFKRSSASREVLRATAEGKSTLPLHSNCIYITVNTQILPVWRPLWDQLLPVGVVSQLILSLAVLIPDQRHWKYTLYPAQVSGKSFVFRLRYWYCMFY